MEAIGAMGIFDAGAAQALAVSSFSTAAGTMGGAVDKDPLKGAMRWDLWNPWAKWYEHLDAGAAQANFSTHPRTPSRAPCAGTCGTRGPSGTS